MLVLREQIGYFWKVLVVFDISSNLRGGFYILPILKILHGLVEVLYLGPPQSFSTPIILSIQFGLPKPFVVYM